MKQFFKMIFASTIGVILASIILTLISFFFLVAIIAGSSKEISLKENSVFHLKLNGQIVERVQKDIYSELFNLRDDTNFIGLDEILSNIRKAKSNDNIKGILIDTDYAMIGISSAREIRNALIDFKESGKFVVATGGIYSQTAYYVSSAADKIILNPSGIIEFKGLAASATFYKNALDKLGIEMQLVKVGTYKSYAEQYTDTSMSNENREQISAYANSIWNTMLEEISASRNISVEKLNEYADEMMTFQRADKSVAYHLADTLLYSDAVKNLLATEMGVDEKKVNFITLNNLKNIPDNQKNTSKEKIAVVYAVGGIDTGSSYSSDQIKSDKLVETLRSIREDGLVKAVVLRVNSPGGSAYGSEQIWREISLLKKEKPVIVSMGDYAASGGYYIACLADAIVAQPTTLTGSIGIFGIIPNVKGLTDKLGITFDVVKTNKMSDMPALDRSFTADEKNLMQHYVNEGYELFVKRCADGREMGVDEIKAIAEGRVWTGKDAQKIGLVDELGGLKEAIDLAAEIAGLDKYKITEYPAKKDFMTEFMESLNEGMETKILKMKLGENYKHYVNIKNMEQQIGTIQAVLPFDVVVK